MSYWIGIFLVVSGCLSLILNEFTVAVRRIWPWRRDGTNPARDELLNEYYRFSVYVGSIGSIELGAFLAESFSGLWLLRWLFYVGFGIRLFWRRPMLRRKQFWRNLLREGVDERSGS